MTIFKYKGQSVCSRHFDAVNALFEDLSVKRIESENIGGNRFKYAFRYLLGGTTGFSFFMEGVAIPVEPSIAGNMLEVFSAESTLDFA